MSYTRLLRWVVAAILCPILSPAWSAQPYYLALGDSLAKGEQWSPTGEVYYQGYAEDLAPAINMRLENLGCGGETSATMVNGGLCTYAGYPSQLAAAEAFVRQNAGNIGLVTIDIGADDYSSCLQINLDFATCLVGKTTQVVADLQTILSGLRAAGGSALHIVAVNYYDPYLAYWLQGATGQLEASATLTAITAFNVAEAAQYALNGVFVADVATAFQSLNVVPTSYADRQVPTNVAVICRDTWMCTHGNIHANTTGYQLIASTIRGLLKGIGWADSTSPESATS
ncbi:SGNH/GDSL hydrolase family protein [Paraburkholderia caffeinilytica]|uniref:SGNH/GDSL hydrolase family protein n=1 Tax=Paraburkholderia caffeinilytica TaxID=1761016 RepID=UPI003DA11DF8